MRGRVGFLLFAIGLFVGAWLRDVLEPPRRRLQVDCAPAVERI